MDRTVATRLVANNSNFDRAYLRSKAIASDFANSLDTSNDRMTNLIQTGLALGPALVPTLAAGGVAAAGLGTSLAAAAVSAGVAALAFHGVGDAVTALNDYQLDPTAENLDKVREAMQAIGPAGRDFASFINDLRPKMQSLQDAAQAGFLPGLQGGIESAMTQFPIFERLISNVAEAMGELSEEGGEALAGPFWTDFFRFLTQEAGPALETLGRTFGNFAEGFAGVFMAFNPLAEDFNAALLDSSKAFSEWGRTLGESQGFQDFTDYVRDTGPQVWDTFTALANTLLQLTKAAAPVGSIVLPVVEALANGLSAVAASPVGPVLIGAAAGLAAVSRAVALYNVANGSALLGFLGKGKEGSTIGAGWKAAAAGVGVFALSLTDLDDKMGISNTAMFTMMGAMAGPWGAAVGGAVGLSMDMTAASDDLAAAIDDANNTIGHTPTAFAAQADAIKNARMELDAADDSWTNAFTAKPFADMEIAALDVVAERARQAISDVSEALGRGAIDTSNFVELERAATEMGPAFEAAGLNIEDWTAAIAAGGWQSVVARTQFAVAQDEIAAFAASQDSIPARSEGVASAIAGLGDEMLSTAQSADTLSAALDALFTPELDLSEATDAWTSGLKTLNKELGGAASKGLQFADVETDLSKAAYKTREALRIRFMALREMLNAQAAAGQSSAQLSQNLKEGRKALLDSAEAAGLSRKETAAFLRTLGLTPKLVKTVIEANAKERQAEVRGYLDTLAKVPKELVTRISQPGFEASHANIQALAEKYDMTPKEVRTVVRAVDNASSLLGSIKALMDRLDGYTATTTVNTVYTSTQGGHVVPNADGSVTDYYADGDVRNGHVAQIAPAGSYRVWAEEETGGESYIPLAASKRQRSLRVWAETGRRLGVQGFADGDVTGPKPLADKTIDVLVAGIRDQFGKQSPLVDIIRQWLEGLKRGEFSQAAFADRFEKALYRQVDPAMRAFNVGPRQDRGETASEVRELLQVLKETFGPDAPIVSRVERMGERLLEVADRQDKAAAKFDRATDKYDAIVERERQLESAVRAAFTHDAFGSEISSVRESLIQLRADANDADRANRQFARLSRKGLNDSVLRQLGESGNTALIAQLSGMTRKQIANYERAFLRRNRELGQLSQFVGNRVFGDERQAQLRVVHRTERTLNKLNHRLSRIEGDIRDGAYHGVKQAIEGRARRQRGRRGAGAVR